MLTSDIPPNQTVCIKNINEKVKKEELKRSLYALFSQYGRILDIVALKLPSFKGRHWLCSVKWPLLVMHCYRCRTSHSMTNLYGYNMRKQSLIVFLKQRVPMTRKRSKRKKPKGRGVEEGHQTANTNGLRSDSNGGAAGTFREGKPITQEAAMEPNHILFIQNLSYETDIMMLELLFKQYPEFREVRMVEAKPGIAFVEFDDDSQSSVAMQDLQGFKITAQNPMVITYAKK